MSDGRYTQATVKFNSGVGALLCSKCRTIIKTGFNHEDKKHYCSECELTGTGDC